MAKPTGAICNLACAYCYYLAKEDLYPNGAFRMTDATLERYVRQYLDSQPAGEVTFAWQGGEPTLMDLAFFERAFELQRTYVRRDQRVVNTLQTNATKLDDAWCRLLRQHDVLVGVSLDGPRDLHDAYRVDKAGAGSFERVMAGIDRLRHHDVPFNVLTTVHAANERHPLRVYRFLRDVVGARHLQFIPIVEPDAAAPGRRAVTRRSVDGRAYGSFLTAVFAEWVRRDVGTVFVQLFDVTLGKYVGAPDGLCVFAETCGTALALEHTGDVYACDHFVDPGHRLGHLGDGSLAELARGERPRAFGQAKRDTLPETCRTCDVLWLCRGGCPKDRLVPASDGEPGLNHLCPGYRRFFTASAPLMRFMADAWRQGRPPADVMQHVAERRGERFSPAGRRRS